ncbi:MAG TPA: response regulator [Pirellulaceae bacterium]|nr:response regulator [Pirellulaceae bacterium]HMO91619.1 response regulator [Pirellulaceae bacterium]HMP68316.1 response regulator [Pirellulaceae bacterium]
MSKTSARIIVRSNKYSGKGHRIMRALVVDDSRSMRRIVCNIMRDLGYDVMEAGDGLEALQQLDGQGVPDVVLTDWNMPNMDGLELVRSVRANANYRDVPMLMITSETEMGKMVVAFAAGVNEYLMKPFDRSMIEEKLKFLGIGA